jgi:hypothetical protein
MKTLFGVLFLFANLSVVGQVVLYSTDFGTGTTLPAGWSVSGAQASNLQVINPSTTASTGYNYPLTASGNSTLNDGGSTGVAVATLTGQINTVGYTSIQVLFGARKTSAYSGIVQLEWSSDGSNFYSVSFTDVASDGSWYIVNNSTWAGLPIGAENQTNLFLRLTFTRSNGSGNYSIDDFTVQGYSSSGTVATDYFRSKQSGNWSLSSSWESSSNNSTWINATLIPTSDANSITIRSGHSITINSNVSADQLTVEPGGVLSHLSGRVFTLNDGTGVDMTVNGTYVLNGTIPVGSGTSNINAGGVVRVDNNTGGESDNFAFSTNTKVDFKTGSVFQWNENTAFETVSIDYFEDNFGAEKPIFRISATNLNVGSNSVTQIFGLLDVTGSVTWTGTGAKYFRDGITGNGDVAQASSGTFYINGTDAQLGGTGVITLSNGGMQIISPGNVFLTSNKTINSSTFDFIVAAGGRLNCSTFVVSGGVDFVLADGGTIGIGSPDGITTAGGGNIQTSGRSYSSAANYLYYGSTNQVTGNFVTTPLANTVNAFSISNTGTTGNNTVTLTINNTTASLLYLNNGLFASGINQTLRIASGGIIYGLGGHNPNNATAGNIHFVGGGSTNGTFDGYPYLYSVIVSNGAVDFNGNPNTQSATIMNSLQLNANGFVTNAPYYQTGSSLIYSTGGVYSRNVEWGSAGGQGYPHHVTVQAGTIVDLNSNPISPAQLEIGGDLTIGNANGSGQVYMNNNISKPLSVKGNLTIGSTSSAANGSILWLSLSIGGDIWLEGNFTRYNNGSYTDNDRAIFFKGSANTSINTPNVSTTPGLPTQYFSYALMDKTNGTETVTLNCPVGIDHSMTFTKGIVLSSTNNPLVVIDNATVTGASDLSFVNGPVKKIGDDAFTFPVGKPLLSNPNVGGYRGIGITPIANTSVSDAFTAEFMQGSATALGPITATGLTRVSRCEYWKLDKTNGAVNLAVHVTASWTARSNCNLVSTVPYVSDLPDLVLAHFNGTSWDSYGANSYTGNTTTGTITWNNVSTFSPFSLGSKDFLENLLPLDVSGFSARARKMDVAIDWMVGNNNEQDEFILERSKDGINFETLKVVPAKVILFTAAYAEDDKQPFTGWNYYRLRALSKLGKEKVSHTVKVWFGREQQISITPNPASEKIIASFAEPSSISQIELVNISGQVLQRIQTVQFNNIIDISHLQAGIYYLRISGKNGLSTKSFIKQ